MLEQFVETLINSLAVGSLYALIALGYTMVYGILKFINFAHSDVFVLGAWMAFATAAVAGWSESGTPSPVPPWVWGMLIALPVLAALAGLYDHGLRPRVGEAVRARLPRLDLTATLALVAAAAWVVLGLVYSVRLIKDELGWTFAAGGVILLVSMLTCGIVGFAIERLAYRPLRRAPRINVLITAIGVSLFLQNLGQLDWMFGTSPRRMPTLLPDRALATFSFGGDAAVVQIRLIDVLTFTTAVLLMIALDWLVFRTRVGRAMRAVSFSPDTASLMGIPVDRVISFTFILGAMLAAAAGFLYGQKYPGLNQPASTMWVLLGLKAFVAAVVGEIGNIRGAMLGGLLIGLLEQFGARYTSPNLRDLYVFAVLILVLLFKPSGILGRSAAEKV